MMIKHCTAHVYKQQHGHVVFYIHIRFIQKLLSTSICLLSSITRVGYWSQCHQLCVFPDSSLLSTTLRPRTYTAHSIAGRAFFCFVSAYCHLLLFMWEKIYIFYDVIAQKKGKEQQHFWRFSVVTKSCELRVALNLFLLIFSRGGCVYNQKGFWRRAGEMMETDCIWFPARFCPSY